MLRSVASGLMIESVRSLAMAQSPFFNFSDLGGAYNRHV
jgi:hypothetical protein